MKQQQWDLSMAIFVEAPKVAIVRQANVDGDLIA
jgi:hypothetical protein